MNKEKEVEKQPKQKRLKKREGVLKYFVAVAFVLAVAFLGQQSYFEKISKNLYSTISEKFGPTFAKTNDWLKASLYPKLGGEAAKRGESLKEEVKTQKDKAALSAWQKVKSYLAQKFFKISGTKVE